MIQPLPWVFEPCENEGPVRDPKGEPWQHACRGRKPARPMVMGYGMSEHDADTDARRKAQQQDEREVLGERGEVVTSATQQRSDSDLGGYKVPPDVMAAIREWFNNPQPTKWHLPDDRPFGTRVVTYGPSILDQRSCYGVRVHYVGHGDHTLSTCVHRTTIDNYNACIAAIATLEGMSTEDVLSMVARDHASIKVEVYTAS